MSADSTKQAQGKSLRHQFSSAYGVVRAFSNRLYAAHGGWHPAQRARDASPGAARGAHQARRHKAARG